MKATYNNRYGDTIVFQEASSDEVHMTGHAYMRIGWDNIYTKAYDAYMADVAKLDEPDFDLLIEDPSQNITRHCTFEEFKKWIHGYYPDRINPLSRYQKLVETDYATINMVDPSGGPYLKVGYDLSAYFGDRKKRIIESIQNQQDKVIFKIKQNG